MAKTATKKPSRHGGHRAGSGRKPGTSNRPNFDHLYQPCADALAKAMDGAKTYQFILAMQALEAPLDDIRLVLGMSRDDFAKKYGSFLVAV